MEFKILNYSITNYPPDLSVFFNSISLTVYFRDLNFMNLNFCPRPSQKFQSTFASNQIELIFGLSWQRAPVSWNWSDIAICKLLKYDYVVHLCIYRNCRPPYSQTHASIWKYLWNFVTGLAFLFLGHFHRYFEAPAVDHSPHWPTQRNRFGTNIGNLERKQLAASWETGASAPSKSSKPCCCSFNHSSFQSSSDDEKFC